MAKIKITSLPPLTGSADGNDQFPMADNSASNTTKRVSFTQIKEWLQSLTSWVTASMRTEVTKMGTFTPSANGDIIVTGVGFKPKSVLFVCAPNTSDTVASAANSGMGVGFGTSDNLNGRYISSTIRNGNGGGQKIQAKSFGITTISAGGGSQNVNYEGVLKSLDSDGFTVTISNWAAQGNVIWIAFA